LGNSPKLPKNIFSKLPKNEKISPPAAQIWELPNFYVKIALLNWDGNCPLFRVLGGQFSKLPGNSPPVQLSTFNNLKYLQFIKEFYKNLYEIKLKN